jgi:glycosyltransferase involved in cell wall biosynthesis
MFLVNKKNKTVTARLLSRYVSGIPSRAPIMLSLDSEKFETIFIYLKKDSNEPNYFEQNGCRVYYISNKKYFRIFNLFAIFKLRKILKNEKVEILHCHMHQSTIYGTIAAKLARVPIILSHVHGINRTKTWRRRLINSLLLRKVSKVLTVGEATREDVLRSNPSLHHQQVVSIGNSVDYEQYANVQISKAQAKKSLGLDEASFVFGTVGRLVPTKGYSYLIDAFTEVKRTIPDAELILIGDGRLKDELAQQAKNTQYSESIHFLGRRDDITELLKGFDAFVLPSVAEGMPRALLEAMASGLPCIATDVGGIPEIVSDREFASLVPTANPQELAKAMIALAGMTNSERNELAERAKQRVEAKYCHERVINRLQDIYQNEMIAKQGFGKYLKNEVDMVEIASEPLPVSELSVQYNPERFAQYKSLHKGPAETTLNMSVSPHCRILQDYETNKKDFLANMTKNDYYKMQRLFGKSHKAAVSKVTRLVKLYESIRKDGFTSKIIVSTEPVIANEYNHGYEIYEGHHRVACCINLGIELVPSRIMEAKPKAVVSTEK